MRESLKALRDYISMVESELGRGVSTEPSHYPCLKVLLETLEPGLDATPNPRRIECGAPDFVVTRGSFIVGYVEAKDVGESLDAAERSDQLARYLRSLPNLVLTDFLEFRWYVDGVRRASAHLGAAGLDGRIRRDRMGMEAVARLLSDFLAHRALSVASPQELARRLARLAHMTRDLIIAAFEREPQGGTLHTHYRAFQETLIPDLRPDQFADMYAQTIAYGLFAARCANGSPSPHAERGSGGGVFSRQNAAFLIPRTNPFLRRLFNEIAGPELDERIAWLVDDLAQLLAQADMEAILRGFGKPTAREDPVIFFYETFLKEYDPVVREMRGVYYTPEPVVSYIVRSIDHLLKMAFGRPQGLADPGILILDPAAGTATFLHAVVQEIHHSLVAQGQRGLWNDYVAERLLPRLFGFELLLAPYAVAHLKLGLLLQETGYRFQSGQRLGIYLTNTLEEAIHRAETLLAQWITEEANAAAEIKREKPIMAVLGNPPYSGISANASLRREPVRAGTRYRKRIGGRWDWALAKKDLIANVPTFIGELLDDYYHVDGQPLGEKNPKWLQDDYVKFIRFGQWRIERTGQGILAFITNHGYLDNPTFRGMRQSLLKTFDRIYILDLHGNVKKRERAPDGGKDENVFDIQQGVAIGIFVKEPEGQKERITSLPTPSPRAERGPGGEVNGARVYHADLWGLREGKYRALGESDLDSTPWAEEEPRSPNYLFVPVAGDLEAEYQRGWPINQVFPVNSVGLVTARDHFVLDLDEEALRERIACFRGTQVSDEEVRERFGLRDTEGWKVAESRRRLRADAKWQTAFTRFLYRPFDARSIFYHDAVIERTRSEVMRHMLAGGNIALICPRRVEIAGPWQHVLATNLPAEHVAVSLKTIDSLFPLYLYPDSQGQQGVLVAQAGRRPNLAPEFIRELERRLGVGFVPYPQTPSPQVVRGPNPPSPFTERGPGGEVESFTPEDIFSYAYAVFHSPTYRSRYAEFLKIDFPRLPLTSDLALFRALAAKGAELVALHLMEAPALNREHLTIRYDVAGSNQVETVRYLEPRAGTPGRVYINRQQYFEEVAPEVWQFQVGGYQVLQKWLKDRKGRKLSLDERFHYQKIVVALQETMRLMEEIDTLIPSWPLP